MREHRGAYQKGKGTTEDPWIDLGVLVVIAVYPVGLISAPP
jgi:hypothetical protein